MCWGLHFLSHVGYSWIRLKMPPPPSRQTTMPNIYNGCPARRRPNLCTHLPARGVILRATTASFSLVFTPFLGADCCGYFLSILAFCRGNAWPRNWNPTWTCLNAITILLFLHTSHHFELRYYTSVFLCSVEHTSKSVGCFVQLLPVQLQ